MILLLEIVFIVQIIRGIGLRLRWCILCTTSPTKIQSVKCLALQLFVMQNASW